MFFNVLGTLANDIINFVDKQLNDDQKLTALESPYQPPLSYTFPVSMEYGKKRSFSRHWLGTYKWLVYSPSVNGAYCKFCALFSDNPNAIRLVKEPVALWTKATEIFKKHQVTESHKTSLIRADTFLKVMQSKQQSVGEALNKTVAAQIKSNRQLLHPIVKTILFCGTQNISLRGHRESMSSLNPGNFRALLKFRVDSGDNLLKQHLDSAPRNATYISNTIQNELIGVIGSTIQSMIVEAVGKGSKIFAVIADESRDVANMEQMPLIIRYIDEFNRIQESFIGFIECEHGTSGMKIANLIETNCLKLGLDMVLCRAQGYDGAGNMAGRLNGAATLLRAKYSKAIYFHCASHKLNLSMANACNIRSVENMMTTITSFATFFNYSPKRQGALEKHVKDYPDSSMKSKLIPLCRTRWVERINAFEVTIDLMEALVDTLSEMSLNSESHWNRDTVSQATSLLKSIDFEFIINLFVTHKIFAYTSGITTSLQTKGIDLANATQQIQLVIRVLEDVRSKVESFHHEWFESACNKAHNINVDVKKPRICGRQTNRQNAIGSTVSGLSEIQLVEEHFRINVTIPFLDNVVMQLQNRFTEGQESVFKGLLLVPSYAVTCSNWEEKVKPFFQFYSDEMPSASTIDAELGMWKQLWNEKWKEKLVLIQRQHLDTTGKEMNLAEPELKRLQFRHLPNDIVSTFKEITNDIFPNIAYSLSILAVLPVTSCEAERTISMLRRLKTYMRSTMKEERLTGLALMNVHADIPLSIEDVITKFAIKKPTQDEIS